MSWREDLHAMLGPWLFCFGKFCLLKSTAAWATPCTCVGGQAGFDAFPKGTPLSTSVFTAAATKCFVQGWLNSLTHGIWMLPESVYAISLSPKAAWFWYGSPGDQPRCISIVTQFCECVISVLVCTILHIFYCNFIFLMSFCSVPVMGVREILFCCYVSAKCLFYESCGWVFFLWLVGWWDFVGLFGVFFFSWPASIS